MVSNLPSYSTLKFDSPLYNTYIAGKSTKNGKVGEIAPWFT